MEKLNLKKNWAYYFGILAGLAIICVGIEFLCSYKIYYGDMSSITFGADFYTEIHNATVYVVNTLRNIHNLLRIAFGSLFIFAGVVDVMAFGSQLKFPVKESSPENESSI